MLTDNLTLRATRFFLEQAASSITVRITRTKDVQRSTVLLAAYQVHTTSTVKQVSVPRRKWPNTSELYIDLGKLDEAERVDLEAQLADTYEAAIRHNVSDERPLEYRSGAGIVPIQWLVTGNTLEIEGPLATTEWAQKVQQQLPVELFFAHDLATMLSWQDLRHEIAFKETKNLLAQQLQTEQSLYMNT